MKDLTEKEVGKCTKLLGWKYKTDHVTYWYVDEAGKIQWCEWEEGHHRQVSLTDVLFAKLWDKLEELFMKPELCPVVFEFTPKAWAEDDPVIKHYCVRSPSAGPVGFGAAMSVYGEATHPCLAFCEAISKLMENKRW